MSEILENLFESTPRVRLLRLFFQNMDEIFTVPEIAARTQVRTPAVKKEIKRLLGMGIIGTRKAIVPTDSSPTRRKKGSRRRAKKQRIYYANLAFEFLRELRELVTKTSAASRKKLLKQIKNLGSVRLAVISGIFIGNGESRTDLLIVGDNIRRKRAEQFINTLESGLGKPLRYTLMDTKEFRYRTGLYDRFLRDILEYPHEKLINALRV